MNVRMNKREFAGWGSIEVGQCFIFNDEVYIKIHEVDEFNCVCLNDGELDYFENEDCLELADAHVLVR